MLLSTQNRIHIEHIIKYTFTRVEHILGHSQVSIYFKKYKLCAMFYDQNGNELENKEGKKRPLKSHQIA